MYLMQIKRLEMAIGVHLYSLDLRLYPLDVLLYHFYVALVPVYEQHDLQIDAWAREYRDIP